MAFFVLDTLTCSSERAVWVATDQFANFGGVCFLDPDGLGGDFDETGTGNGHWEEDAEIVVFVRACGLVEVGKGFAYKLMQCCVLVLASTAAIAYRCTVSASCGRSFGAK